MKKRSKITVPILQKMKNVKKITMATAYDFTMARLLDQACLDVLLVGDSLGMVMQGKETTLEVTLDEMCYHSRLVTRGTEYAHVVGDLPFMSYQISPEQALLSASRLIKEGGVASVKLEGGQEMADTVYRLVTCGIPVMGHVGLTPQSVNALGGFKVQGRDEKIAAKIRGDVYALQTAGAYAIVLEAIPSSLACQITKTGINIPTIGIGAGPSCDGQVLVCNDFLGITPEPTPRFVKRFHEIGSLIVDVARNYVNEVQTGAFPSENFSYADKNKNS